MTFDWDDLTERDNHLDLLSFLHDLRPDFRCTLFAIPGLGTPRFWDSVPDWCELALHGWKHPTPMECADWGYDRSIAALAERKKQFVHGWKSPGWQTSPGMYEALASSNWWIADQHYYDDLRPAGLRTYLWEDGDNWHGHISPDAHNGIVETWDEVVKRVREAESFEFASERTVTWAGTLSKSAS